MRIIEAGHIYEMHNVDGEPGDMQLIRFVRRRSDDAKLMPSFTPGILAQELLRVLIDRTLYLNAEAPCAEDMAIIEKLRDCLKLYEARAARRTIEKLPMPEMQEVCGQCHHILCLCDHPTKIEHGIDR